MKTDRTGETLGKMVGIRLNQFRRLLGKSVRQMAEELELKESKLRKLEAGSLNPYEREPGNLLGSLYKCYGINLTWLYRGRGFIFAAKKPLVPREVFFIALNVLDCSPDPVDIECLIRLKQFPMKIHYILDSIDMLTDELNGMLKEISQHLPQSALDKIESLSRVDSYGENTNPPVGGGSKSTNVCVQPNH